MKFLLVAASVIAVTYGHSPVLLWPAEEFAVPDGQSALDSMNLDDFKKLFDGKKIVVFHKKQFLLEEVSYPKKQLSYLQSVDAIALQGVKSIHHFVGGLTSSNNLEFVRLDDGPLDEQQEEEIKNKMESKPGFAAILLGSGSHKSRRAAENKFACTSEANDPCMAYVGAIEMSDEKLVGTCKVTCQGGSGLTITISGGTEPVELTVKNDVESGGYNLGVSSPYNIDSETTWAPKMFSYSCSALRLIPRVTSAADKKPTISLSRLQVWPDRRDKDHPQKDEFPESYDCATWFTPATWMGVMIAMFYIFLLFGAVVFLLDVKTNDRFDDPKGKTITVNVAE